MIRSMIRGRGFSGSIGRVIGNSSNMIAQTFRRHLATILFRRYHHTLDEHFNVPTTHHVMCAVRRRFWLELHGVLSSLVSLGGKMFN